MITTHRKIAAYRLSPKIKHMCSQAASPNSSTASAGTLVERGRVLLLLMM